MDQGAVASIWTWILTLLFGAGAGITPTPVNLAAGDNFFKAAKPLTPVDDAMRVGIDLGPATEERKKAVLSGLPKLSDVGDVRVEVCRTRTECIPMKYSGPYFSRDSYGIGFDANGPQLKHVTFIGVKVTVDRPVDRVTISWSNYSQ
jgi:hypothetical protein